MLKRYRRGNLVARHCVLNLGPSPFPTFGLSAFSAKERSLRTARRGANQNGLAHSYPGRSFAYHYDTKVLKIVEQANSASTSIEILNQELAQLEKNDFDAAKTTAEKQMVQFAYEETLALLKDTTRADRAGAPPSEAALNARSRLLIRVSQLQAAKPALAN